MLQFKETEQKLRGKIGERKLWFEADTLWQQIRDVRFITQKNPFYYHLNFSRLKTVCLQLKASAPEPLIKEKFIENCRKLFEYRTSVLRKIQMIDENVYLKLKGMVEPLPDFNTIK